MNLYPSLGLGRYVCIFQLDKDQIKEQFQETL